MLLFRNYFITRGVLIERQVSIILASSFSKGIVELGPPLRHDWSIDRIVGRRRTSGEFRCSWKKFQKKVWLNSKVTSIIKYNKIRMNYYHHWIIEKYRHINVTQKQMIKDQPRCSCSWKREVTLIPSISLQFVVEVAVLPDLLEQLEK